jgi:hypothetical protein
MEKMGRPRQELAEDIGGVARKSFGPPVKLSPVWYARIPSDPLFTQPVK